MAQSISRTTFFDNGDLCYHAQVQELNAPPGVYALSFTSQKRVSKAPREEAVKFFVCLNKDELCKLSQLLHDAASSNTAVEVQHGLL